MRTLQAVTHVRYCRHWLRQRKDMESAPKAPWHLTSLLFYTHCRLSLQEKLLTTSCETRTTTDYSNIGCGINYWALWCLLGTGAAAPFFSSKTATCWKGESLPLRYHATVQLHTVRHGMATLTGQPELYTGSGLLLQADCSEPGSRLFHGQVKDSPTQKGLSNPPKGASRGSVKR